MRNVIVYGLSWKLTDHPRPGVYVLVLSATAHQPSRPRWLLAPPEVARDWTIERVSTERGDSLIGAAVPPGCWPTWETARAAGIVPGAAEMLPPPEDADGVRLGLGACVLPLVVPSHTWRRIEVTTTTTCAEPSALRFAMLAELDGAIPLAGRSVDR